MLYTHPSFCLHIMKKKMHFDCTCILWTNDGTLCDILLLVNIQNYVYKYQVLLLFIKSCFNSPYLLSLLFGLAGEWIRRLSVGGGGRDWGPVYPLGSGWGTRGAFQKPIIWIRTTSSWYNKKPHWILFEIRSNLIWFLVSKFKIIIVFCASWRTWSASRIW